MIGQTRFVTVLLFSALSLSCSPKVSQVKESIPTNEIQNIRIAKSPEKTEVVVEGQQPMVYTTFHLTDPDRLIVDMAGIGLGRFTDKVVLEEGPVHSVHSKAGEGSQVSRLEIELKEPSETDVRTEGTNLIVEVTTAAEPDTEKAQNPSEPIGSPLPDAGKDEVVSPPAKMVNQIRFDKSDGLNLVLTVDGRLVPEVFMLDKDRLVIDLPNVTTTMPARSIPANDPTVKQVRIGRHSDKLRLVLDLLMPIGYSWKQSENELRFDLYDETKRAAKTGAMNPSTTLPASPGASTGLPMPAGDLTSEKEKAAAPSSDELVLATTDGKELDGAPSDSNGGSSLDRPQEKAAGPENTALENGEKPLPQQKKSKSAAGSSAKYVGRKISLDFQDADITNVVRLIADVSNLNIVMGDDVTGKVTLKLVNVPWDQALDIILKMNNLGQIREGNIIRVATLANIAKQQDEEARAKETKIRAEDLMTRIIYVNYGKAQELSEPLKKILSSRGEITIDERTNTMIVKDIEKNIDEVERLARTLDSQTPQVVIEARIVQVAPTFNRSLGIQWGATFRDIGNSNITSVANPAAGSPFGAPAPDFAVNLPAASSFGGIGFTFGRFTENPLNLDLRISAGESQGLTRIISTPKVAVLDNQEAKIEQGESIPFSTVSQQGTQTTFVDANLTLLVTPHISSDGGIMMKIKVSKNAPGETRPGAAGPSILKKEATTHILVKDGETTVIGGIYEVTKSDSVSGIPFLMDIPVLGWLFKTTTKREDTSELLVFLTPRILK